MKKIMILGGGDNQVPLIRRAKELGLYVVLCDFREEIPGKALSDVHYQVNTLNAEEVISVGKKEKPDGILTNSEPAFVSQAEAATALGLRSMSMADTLLYKNKFLMREFCERNGIPSPAFKRCSTVEEAMDFFRHIGKKCIIKPLDNSASRGVFSINDEEDLIRHFPESIGASSRSNHYVLIEEYISGTEFTIDGLMGPQGHRCLAISEKRHYAYNENVANQLLFDNANAAYDYNELRKVNDGLVDKTGLAFGLTHAEYKYADGKFYLIEIQARGGGNFIATDIVPFISGIDSYTEQIRWCVGDEPKVCFDYASMTKRCAVLHFFDVPGKGGVVKSIGGLDYFGSLGEKMMYHLDFKVGDTIQETRDDSTRIGWYILKTENRGELDSLMGEIDRHFKIIV